MIRSNCQSSELFQIRNSSPTVDKKIEQRLSYLASSEVEFDIASKVQKIFPSTV